jgi:hypothetical protein
MHKHILLATVATFASLGLAGTASASSYQGWYGSAELGLNIASDEDGVNDTIDTTFSRLDPHRRVGRWLGRPRRHRLFLRQHPHGTRTRLSRQ